MVEAIIKIILVFVAVYIVWYYTGGVERGEERANQGGSNIFIEVEDRGEPLFDTNLPDPNQLNGSNNL